MRNILIHTIILLFVLTIKVAAKDWSVTTFKNFVSLQYQGKITYGDTINFNLPKKNCNKVNYLFSVYSMEKNPEFMNLKDKKIPLNINGINTWANTIYVYPFLMGYRGMFYLGSYDIEDLSKFFEKTKNYKIQIVDRDGFNAKDYFDVDYNEWNLEGFSKAIREAQNTCKSFNS